MRRLPLIVFGLLLCPSPARADDAGKVFEERIAPIFKSPNPSSCVECHLAAVDLKDYILPSPKDTFLALRDQGLIDLKTPEDSKILQLINRGTNNPKPSGLIPAKQRQAEYDAFAAWIKACAADPAYRDAPKPEKALPLGTKPVEVVRYARKDRMIESFESNVWAMRFRCMNCHTEGTPQNDKLVKESGERVGWFKKAGPAATMEYLLSGKLIDAANPEKSLLLTKPLGTVKHGGGIKFAPGDQGYKAMRAWIDEVAAIRSGTYARAEDLPTKESGPKRFGTDLWLKLDKTPDAWGDKLLQVDVFVWDDKAAVWEKEPVATSDRVVWGKGKLWQHNLTLLAAPGSERAKSWAAGKPTLPTGKYLVKVYLDVGERAKADWKAKLGPDEFVGSVEVQSRWPEGYNAMTTADGTRVRK
ncbi:hypothetical protein [Frigoriglobus tundricola]|uniref:Cytochrome c domain-containing protein n=1 Tax=Frigoriglobus tundricola TaxID=2774151 RepID=A0A6M5YNT4_9BACT|nr:hypothetical protein [Frigoriglobus tundricola]QJW95749.1 hypothetical protein FTUN_3303 [Frigoriglobus tundricola]